MTDETTQLSENVTLTWLDDKKIANLTVTAFSRKDLDVWASAIEKLVSEWREDVPYALLHDIRTGALSPYAQAKAKQLLTFLQEQNKRGRYAVLVENNIFGQAISMFVNITLRMNAKQYAEGKSFTSRENALNWLREQF